MKGIVSTLEGLSVEEVSKQIYKYTKNKINKQITNVRIKLSRRETAIREREAAHEGQEKLPEERVSSQ